MHNSGRVNPDVLVFYHYFYPDDVVSARHLTGLTTGLAESGCSVEVMPSNRACRSNKKYSSTDFYRGVTISRVFRPAWNQAQAIGRILNLSWMLIAWSLKSLTRKPDIVIVGTDPILSILIALPWKLFRPGTKIVHWCFDLYPDAAIESGLLPRNSIITRCLNWVCYESYQRCDAIVDIGQCMRARLPTSPARQVTLTPWALVEPKQPAKIDRQEREKVFGHTRLAILYSGNFGEAHSYVNVLSLARSMRDDDVVFAFSVRGNRADALRNAVTEDDHNIRFVDFAEESKLEARLACADIHLVTLNPGWEGIVVPSKFFGALAIGRPVLFDGPPSSAVAHWIKNHDIGWHLSETSSGTVSATFSKTSAEAPSQSPTLKDSGSTRQALLSYEHNFEKPHKIYQDYFSYRAQVRGWIELLKSL